MNFLKNIKRAAFVLVGLCLCIGSVRSFPAAAEEEAEGLIMPPAVVLRADTAADCSKEKISAASNLVISVDENLNVTAADGGSLGKFDSFYGNIAAYPVVSLAEGKEDAFVDYIKEKGIWDISVLGTSSVLKKVRGELPEIRGVLDMRLAENVDDAFEAVKETNSSRARTVLLNAAAASRELVDYIQARLLTVWVNAENDEEHCRGIFSGAYGIVTQSPEKAHSIYQDMGADSFVRTSYMIGHRGVSFSDQTKISENSLAAYRYAIDCGATHIETDLKVTADNHIVIMHDDTLNTSPTGTGVGVESSTLEEIKTHRLKDGQEIPTLDEALTFLKGKPVVLILEIKSAKENILPLLREQLQKHDMFDQCVVATFYTEQLLRAAELIPEVPTGLFGGLTTDRGFAASVKLVCSLNTAWFCTPSGAEAYSYADATEKLRDRGLTAWGNPDSKTATGAYASYSRGICGLMLDAPQDISELPYNLKAEKEYEVALGKTEELMAVLQKYAGEERVQCGYKLLSGTLEKEGDTALAVLTCTTETPAGEFTYVSETVTLRAVSSGDKSDKNGCGSSTAGYAAMAVPLIFMAAARLRKK